ncbi:MAG TPA: FliH/SctL family protein [Verrucomicrobiae bacterium]|jgi:flagellar assembly protein FliH|nr:FliH/SctL family protein [Verrucomicrobiae bacterium]
MKWSESIPFNQPLHDVRVLANSPSQDWTEHLREREQAAYERGRHEGEDSLRQQLIDQRNEMGGALNNVIESLRKAVPQLVQESESALIQIALESAQKVVAGLPITAKMVDAVVREALQQVEDTGEVTIQLHPDDLALLRKQKTKTLESAPESGPLRFVGSAEVTRGGCLVQTRFGIIDARRETKFEQLQEAAAA